MHAALSLYRNVSETGVPVSRVPAQLQMIVDFPVEDNRSVAIITNDGLVSALQINDFQARRAHGENARAEHSALIRPAMS